MTTTTTAITFDITEPLTVSGAVNCLILDPETRRVYSWSTVGSGTPVAVWNRQQITIGFLPDSYAPESLAEWLRGESEALAAIAGGYQGDEWDGHNHVGSWTEEATTAAGAFSEAVRGAIGGAVSTTWAASDWLYGDIASVRADALIAGTITAAVDGILAFAKGEGVHLDRVDVEATLRGACEDAVDKGSEPAAELAALLATA